MNSSIFASNSPGFIGGFFGPAGSHFFEGARSDALTSSPALRMNGTNTHRPLANRTATASTSHQRFNQYQDDVIFRDSSRLCCVVINPKKPRATTVLLPIHKYVGAVANATTGTANGTAAVTYQAVRVCSNRKIPRNMAAASRGSDLRRRFRTAVRLDDSSNHLRWRVSTLPM
jgi:hypothetical protein